MPSLRPARYRIRAAWITTLLLALALVSCWKVDADLLVSTTSIDFKTTKVTNPITIKNDSKDKTITSGVVTLEYKLTCDKAWISVTPTSGSCGALETHEHTVSVDRSKMVFGENLGTISITSNGGDKTIRIRAVRPVPGCDFGPTAPVVSYPPSGATSVGSHVEFSWTGGDSRCADLTATYDVYFGTTSPPPFDHDNDTLKVWNPGPLEPNTIYYWRVIAKDANGETNGGQWSLQTVCDLGPSSVTLLSPADGANGVGVNDALTWGGGASRCLGLTYSYDVYFGTVSPPPFHHNTTEKVWTPGGLTRGETYYWKIVAKDDHGTASSPVRSFTTSTCTLLPFAPTPLSPADGATNVPIMQTLTWSGGASQCGLTTSFDIYFGTSSSPPLVDNTTLKVWSPGTMANSTRYYWKIVAKDSNGGTQSVQRTFLTAPPVCALGPTAPVLGAPPVDATNVPLSQDLMWSAGNSQCAGLTATYDVYFGTTSTPPFDHNNGTAKTWSPTLEYDTQYFWRVVAKDNNGTKSSELRSFRTPCHLSPTTVNLLAPAANATNVSINADISWGGGASQCPGLTSTYDVYFGITASPPLRTNTTLKYWDPGLLLNGTTYYWKIVAKDANGTTSSAVRSFTTGLLLCVLPPLPVELLTPANQATNIDIDSNVSWTGGNSQCPGLTATYDVYFGTALPPPLAEANVSVKTWNPGTLNQGVTYYWKVVARDESGTMSSATWRFQTEPPACTDPPLAACTPTPGNNEDNRNRDVDLAWQCGTSACGSAVTYDVYFGTTATPGEEEKVGTTSSKSWALPRLSGKTKYYWKVVTRDTNGETAGPVWSFTTKK